MTSSVNFNREFYNGLKNVYKSVKRDINDTKNLTLIMK
jgi:hypothetical protein